MATVLVDIGKALAVPYAKDMWNQVNSKEYGDAEKSTQAILTAIKDAKHNITLELTAFMLTQELGKHLSQITTWTEALARCLLAKHRDWKDAERDFTELGKDLEHNTLGIGSVLDHIDSILRKTTSIGHQGLIKLGCQKLDEELVNPTQLDKDMCWYMMEMNKFLIAVIDWQTAGLALLLFTAGSNKSKSDYFLQAWKTKIDAQLDYTYQSYHPMIKSFKFSFWDQIPDSRLWRFRVPKGPDGWIFKGQDRYLCKAKFESMVSASGGAGQESDPAVHFKFSPTLDKPNSQNQSGQWSYMQNAGAAGEKVWGMHVVKYEYGVRVSYWTWQSHSDMPWPWEIPRFKLCPVDKESRLFKMVAEAEAQYRAKNHIHFFWDKAFEADYVEGSG